MVCSRSITPVVTGGRLGGQGPELPEGSPCASPCGLSARGSWGSLTARRRLPGSWIAGPHLAPEVMQHHLYHNLLIKPVTKAQSSSGGNGRELHLSLGGRKTEGEHMTLEISQWPLLGNNLQLISKVFQEMGKREWRGKGYARELTAAPLGAPSGYPRTFQSLCPAGSDGTIFNYSLACNMDKHPC